MSRRSKQVLFCLALVFLVGGFFRFYGLRVGLPFEQHVDEGFIANKTLEMYRLGEFKPPAFDYPSLIYYVLLAGAYLVGLFREPALYDLYIIGRTVSALFGTATIGVVYLTGKRAYDERTGLLASAFFACTVTAFRESHYYTTDSINSFFIALAVYFIVRVGLGDDRRNYLYAGIAVGLAAGSKYNGLFLSLPFLFAHLARPNPDGAHGYKNTLRSLPAKMFSKWLVAAALLSLAVFFLTTPYAVISPQEFLNNLTKISHALSRQVVEGNHHYLNTTPYWYYVENLLFWAMGPVLEAASLAGFFYALARRRRQDIIIAFWMAVYFAVVGGWLNKAVRYTLPMLPFLTLFAALMFVETYDFFKARRQQKRALFVAALACVTLCATFLYALAYMNVYARPHTGIQATRWASANIPRGSTILLEEPTPQERPQPDAARMVYGDASFDARAHGFRFKSLWVPKFSDKHVDPVRARAELEELLEEVDYIVMSTRWYEGLVNSPEASPVIRDYYRALRSGDAGFELVREITVYPSLFGFELNDDSSELNFRIFDHPKVWIFRKRRD
jgi:4-amino-4-deoxy-L-arabinose transferase-like glycosyltransferase